CVLRTAVHLGVALLPSVSLYLADGHAGHAQGVQRLLDRVELVRLDHRSNELHLQLLHAGETLPAAVPEQSRCGVLPCGLPVALTRSLAAASPRLVRSRRCP